MCVCVCVWVCVCESRNCDIIIQVIDIMCTLELYVYDLNLICCIHYYLVIIQQIFIWIRSIDYSFCTMPIYWCH